MNKMDIKMICSFIATGKNIEHILHIIVNYEEYGYDPGEEVNGTTALICACEHKQHMVANALIKTGKSRPECVNKHGSTALMNACKQNMPDIAIQLIETGKSMPGQTDKNGFTALMYACRTKMHDVAICLIMTGESKPEYVNAFGQSALTYAHIKKIRYDVIEMLMEFMNQDQ